eukprot:scaffold23390_cov74-Phaeocystis_antarctica.AAC.3
MGQFTCSNARVVLLEIHAETYTKRVPSMVVSAMPLSGGFSLSAATNLCPARARIPTIDGSTPIGRVPGCGRPSASRRFTSVSNADFWSRDD